jgi:hypothetical protein
LHQARLGARHRHPDWSDEQPEAAILTKLRVYAESGSERHLRDIESILRVSGEVLDLAYIDRAAIRAGLFEHWRVLRGNG